MNWWIAWGVAVLGIICMPELPEDLQNRRVAFALVVAVVVIGALLIGHGATV